MKPLRHALVLSFALLLLLPGGRLSADEGPTTLPKVPQAGATKSAEPSKSKTGSVAVTGRYEVVDGQRVLTLWGGPRERGFAQGYLLAAQIVAGVEKDFGRIMNARFKQLYDTLLTKMVVPRFHFTKRETAELEGLMKGLEARLPAAKRTISALGRPFALVDLKALNTFGDWYGLGCSSLAAWGKLTIDGETLVGRNFDFPAFDLVLKHQYVVVRAPEKDYLGEVGVSYPGCIGTITGMNTRGVFVAIHDVHVKPTLDKALRPNVPRLLAVRRLLEKTRGADACRQARDLARSWPTLYGNNLMVVASERGQGMPRAAVLEYDGRTDVDKGCTMRVGDKGEAAAGDDAAGAAADVVCLACTNHHRCREPILQHPPLFPLWRYKKLYRIAGDERSEKPLDVAGMFAWIARAAFPRGDRVQESATSMYGEARHHGTLHEVVAEPEAGRLHVKLGVVGKHIRDVTPRTYDVRALVKAATPKTPSAKAAAAPAPVGAGGK